MAVLHAKPLGWASFGARILSGNEELAQLQISSFRLKGSFEVNGDTFTIEPRGFFQVNADLKKGISIIARVEKPSALRRRFEVSSGGHRLVLESRTWSGRDYVLLLGSQEVGWIRKEGFIGRRLSMEFPDDVPLFLQVFLAYIVIAQGKREGAAAAAS